MNEARTSSLPVQALTYVKADTLAVAGFPPEVPVRSMDGFVMGILHGVFVDVTHRTFEYAVIGSIDSPRSYVVHAEDVTFSATDGTLTLDAPVALIECLPSLTEFSLGSAITLES